MNCNSFTELQEQQIYCTDLSNSYSQFDLWYCSILFKTVIKQWSYEYYEMTHDYE